MIRLRTGDRVFLDDTPYRVIGRDGGTLVLESEIDQWRVKITDHDLASRVANGTARLQVGRTAGSDELLPRRDFGSLSDEDQQDAIRKRAYLLGLEREMTKLSRKGFASAAARIAAEIGDPNPPCYETVCRWRKRGSDPRDLAPRPRPGNRTDKLKPAIREIVERVVNKEYLNTRKISVAQTHRHVEAAIQEHNETYGHLGRLTYPSANAVRTHIARLDKYEVAKAREGKRIADLRHQPYRRVGAGDYQYPLDLVEIDHTKTDMFVIDDVQRLPIGKATLTIARDRCTQMPIGLYAGFEPPSFLSVNQCLRNAILPKNYIEQYRPSLQHDWPCYGVPLWLRTDRGMEFIGKDLRDLSEVIGINLDHNPSKTPNYKPGVERFFRTHNQELIHGVPGRTLPTLFDDEYDAEKAATISLSAFMRLIHVWIIDVYAREPHEGMRDLPYYAWMEGVKEMPVRMIEHIEDLDAILGRVERRRLTNNRGIELFNIQYTSDELVYWLRDPAFSKALPPDGKLKIKYDPAELGHIYVLDPRTLRFLRVPTTMPDYANGLSIWQHRVIQYFVRRRLAEQIDRESLIKARRIINEIIEDEWVNRRTTRSTASRMARFQQIGIREPGYTAPQSSIEQRLAPALVDDTSQRQAEKDLYPLATNAATDTPELDELPPLPSAEAPEVDEEIDVYRD